MPPTRRAIALIDPAVVGLSSLVVLALHGYQSVLTSDLGTFVYGGEHVAQGVAPYRGVFNSVGPLADAVPGLAIWLGNLVGVDPVLASRVFFTGTSALCCALACALARDTFASRAAGYVGAVTLLVFERFVELGSGGPREKTTMVLLLLVCLLLLGRRLWVWAGVCAALATLTWQPVFAVVVVAVVVAAVLDRADRWPSVLARFTLGGFVTSAVTLLYFYAAGALRLAVDGFIVVNVRYASQPSPVASPRGTLLALWKTYHVTLYVLLVGLAALVVLAVRALPRARRASATPEDARLVVAAAGGVAATIWSMAVLNGAADLLVVLPFAAVGVAGLVVTSIARLEPRRAMSVATAVVVVAVVFAGIEAVQTRNDLLVTQRADVRAVLATQPPGAVVLSIGAPEVLALARRDNPTSYQLFTPTMDAYLDDHYPGGLAGYARRVEQLHPTFIVLGVTHDVPWADRVLAAGYRKIGRSIHWVWYLNRSAGHEAATRARRAHERAMAAGGG